MSCSCNKLLLSSLGTAANLQPKVMGIYTRSYTSYICPYQIVSGWMVYSSQHGVWLPDTTLV